MLVPRASHDLRELLAAADVAAAMSVEGLLGTDAVFAADLQALRPQPGQAASAAQPARGARGQRDRRERTATRGVHPRAGRLLAALRARRCTAPPATPSTTPHGSPSASWPPPSTTRSSRRTAGSSPTATSTARRSPTCSTSSRSRSPTSPRSSERRTDRFLDVARSHGLPPFLADDPGVDSGLMIAQYTQAAIVSRAQAARRPGIRRLDPDLGDAGGPRLDGLVGRAQAAPRRRRPRPACSRSRCSPPPAASTCARRSQPAPATAAVVAALRAAGARRPRRRPLPRARDRGRRTASSSTAPCVAAAESVTGPLTDRPDPMTQSSDGAVAPRRPHRTRGTKNGEPPWTAPAPSAPPAAPSSPPRAGRPRPRCGC